MPDALDRVRAALLVGVLVAVIPLMLLRRIEARVARDRLETDDSSYVLPEEQFLRPLSIGYREAAAGVTWIKLLTYFGGEHEVRGPQEHVERYVNAVTTLDPFFYHAYTFGSAAALYNGRLIDRHAVETSIRILKRGLKVFPEDGELHYLLGFQYYFELPYVLGPRGAKAARETGADEICHAAILGGGPPFLPLVCSKLAKNVGLGELVEDYLVQSLGVSRDPSSTARIEERIESLMPRDRAFKIIDAFGEHRRQWYREMPYVPGAFYAIAGPRPPTPVSGEVLLPLPMDAIVAAELEELYLDDEQSGNEESNDSTGELPDADDSQRADGMTESAGP